jgi:hypothetical protein
VDEPDEASGKGVRVIKKLQLRSAVPSDRPQILAWENADRIAVRELCNLENADYMNYRDDLLNRTSSSDRFLVLDRYVDRELQRIRHLCATTRSNLIVLHELDALVAYLESTPGKIASLFWDRLIQLRQLQTRLWIVLPSSSISPLWPPQRLKAFSAQTTNGTPQ